MPEVITKYPDVAIQLLSDAGFQCRKGIKPRILTACPTQQFCVSHTGEICVYGIKDIPKMTQISPTELATVTSNVPLMTSTINIGLLCAIFVAGVVFGLKMCKKK